MKHSILHYRSGNAYLEHLESLDEDTLLDEFYTSKRLHMAVKKRTDLVCRTVVNQFYMSLKYINHEDIVSYDAYLLRFLLNFERFIRREMQYINKLHDFDNAKPIRGIAPPEEPRAPEAYCAFGEMLQDLQRLERIVFALEEKLRLCVVKKDGSYDWHCQLEDVRDILRWVIEDIMECDIQKFEDDSAFREN